MQKKLFSREMRLLLGYILSLSAAGASCQTSTAKPESSNTGASAYTPHQSFDVASIRESREGNSSYIDNVTKSSLFHAEHVSAWALIVTAYDIKIGKLLEKFPAWAETDRWNVMAKSDFSTDQALAQLSVNDFYAEKHHMLRELLAERFRLRIHQETRISVTYELLTSKRTGKLMTHTHSSISKTISSCNTHFSQKGKEVISEGCPFQDLLSSLQQELGTNIIDNTGMSGVYAYRLAWGWSSVILKDDANSYPRLIDALRDQLGLQLKETQGPVTYWVVDHIEHPTAN